jgi:IclR family acetate operon transcriptional repressor
MGNAHYMLAALAHGLDVIEFLAGEKKPSLLGAVASAIGMSKAGTHRILSTLAERGFVVRGEGGVYSLGYKAWEIGWSVPGVQMVPRAVPVMQRLAAEIGDGAILGALDSGFEVVYLHVIESTQAVRVYIDVGSRLPAHVTATGLACLAWLPPERLRAILPKSLPAWTSETITQRDALLRELETIRVRGYAQTLGTFRSDVGGVAAPIFAPDGNVGAAVCVSSPRYRIDAAWNRRVPRAVMAAASEISGGVQPAGANRTLAPAAAADRRIARQSARPARRARAKAAA